MTLEISLYVVGGDSNNENNLPLKFLSTNTEFPSPKFL